MSLPITRYLPFVEVLLAVIGLPHRYDVTRIAARCPHHDHHAAPKVAGADDPNLAIVLTAIDFVRGRLGENLRGFREIQTPFAQRPVPLPRIERDPHIYCIHKKSRGQFVPRLIASTRATWSASRPAPSCIW